MTDYRASLRYSRALVEVAAERKELERADSDFHKVIGLLDRHPEISHLVLNSTISYEEKEDFLHKIFGPEISPTLLDFLKVLLRKKRFGQIGDIQSLFHRLCEKRRGIQEVRVITASPLTEAGEAKLKKALQGRLKAEIRLLAETDPAILGGMILRFDGTEVNTSFKYRLSEMRQILIG